MAILPIAMVSAMISELPSISQTGGVPPTCDWN